MVRDIWNLKRMHCISESQNGTFCISAWTSICGLCHLYTVVSSSMEKKPEVWPVDDMQREQ